MLLVEGGPRISARRGPKVAITVGLLLLGGALLVAVRQGHFASARSSTPASLPTHGFEERAEASGITFRTTYLAGEQGENFKINLYDHGAGLAVGDADGDGRDDVYFANQLGRNALYRNLGGGRFEDVTGHAGPIDLADRISVSAVWGDYDNDGRQDLYVVTTRGGNALFHNEGGGRFRDVTETAGVAYVGHSQSATFFDADGDGFLDLLVSNTARWTLDTLEPEGRYHPGVVDLFTLVDSPPERNLFFRNQGDGTFRDETDQAGLAGTGWSGDTAVFDFDEDGDLDVVLANMFGASHVYENDGRGVFTDVVERVLGRVSWGAVGCKAFDYDNDGRLDLFLVDMHSDMWMEPLVFRPTPGVETIKFRGPFGPNEGPRRPEWADEFLKRLQVEPERVVFGSTLWRALGGGRFEEVSDAAGVETLWPWGIATGDYDGDGFEDAFVPSGMGFPYAHLPSRLLMNRGDGTFVNRAALAGIDPMPGGPNLPGRIRGREIARSARAAATADFDGDGRLDLVVSNFNDRAFLYMNRWEPQAWVGFRLRGTRSNRDAVGAVVRLRVGGQTLTRQVHAAGGYLAQSSLTLHFGLGEATRIESAEVTWPGGHKQALGDLSLGRVHEVVEPR